MHGFGKLLDKLLGKPLGLGEDAITLNEWL